MYPQRNFEFESFLRNAVNKSLVGSVIGLVVLCLLTLFFLGFGFAIMFAPVIIIGLLPLGGIVLMFYRFRGDLKGTDYWLNMIVNDPGKIIWITPVSIRHTPGYVFVLADEMNFEILDSDGVKILIKCGDRKNQLVFLYGLKQYVPHAHFGFNDRVEFFYKSNPKTFLHELHANGLYAPIHNLLLNQDSAHARMQR